MCPSDTDRMANSVDPDQAATSGVSDQSLYCLPRHVCPKTKDYYSKILNAD